MQKYVCLLVLIVFSIAVAGQQKQWVYYKGESGAGNGKHIVFVSGDEEYRSEEALPMLAQILAKKHGFNCTVLFSIDPKTGEIDANNQTNIPGLRLLEKADLMVIFTRFRELPDSQMRYIDNYLKMGKPVVAMRTSTHAFNYTRNVKSIYSKYDYSSKVKGWEGGFGKKILGETWIDHHGVHGKEGTRGLINGILQKHPILNNVKDIWCPTDVYSIKALPADAEVLVFGQSTLGMTSSSPVNLDKSIMPVAWIRSYTSDSGKKGRVFASTMGASIDLKNEDLRRLFVNACYWATGLTNKIAPNADVEYVKEYNPTMFGFNSFKKGAFPGDF